MRKSLRVKIRGIQTKAVIQEIYWGTYYSNVMFRFAAVFAGLAVVSLAAATQVWEYPKPRTDFGFFTFFSTMLAMLFWAVSVVAHGIVKAIEACKPTFLRLVILMLLQLAAVSGMAYLSYFAAVHHMATCLVRDLPVCNQKKPTGGAS